MIHKEPAIDKIAGSFYESRISQGRSSVLMGGLLYIVDAQELVGSGCHVDQIRLALGSFLVHETVHRVILWLCFQQAVHNQKQGAAQFRRPAFGSPVAFGLMGAGLVSPRVNPGKGRNGVLCV